MNQQQIKIMKERQIDNPYRLRKICSELGEEIDHYEKYHDNEMVRCIVNLKDAIEQYLEMEWCNSPEVMFIDYDNETLIAEDEKATN